MSNVEEDRKYMGTPDAAKSDLIAKARAWRNLRQPSIDTRAGHRARDAQEGEARFQLANAALLWLWHEENPPAAPEARGGLIERLNAKIRLNEATERELRAKGHDGPADCAASDTMLFRDVIAALSPRPDGEPEAGQEVTRG